MKNIISNKIQYSLLILTLLSVWSILIYSNTFYSSFHYDDYRNIVNNANVHWDELSLENFKKIFTVSDVLPAKRPVALLTFSINYYFGQLDVQGYHFVNLGIHIFTAFGLFLFLKTVFSLPLFAQNLRERSSALALVAASLWLSSPLQTQAVTYIVQRMAALAAMFYIYAMYFYLKGRTSFDGKSYLYYFLTALFTVLAFASKENAYVLPFYLLLTEFILIRKGDYRFLLKKRVLIGISTLVVALAVLIWFRYASWMAVEPGSWMIYQYKTRFLTGCRVILFYVVQLFLPIPSRLSLEHDFELSRSLFDPISTFFTIVVLCSLVFYVLKSIKRYPLFAFFTLWFLGNLAIETFYPTLTLIFEHRLYLPSMGFFALAAVGFGRVLTLSREKWIRWLLCSLMLMIVMLFSVNTYNRNAIWGNEESLWSDVIKKSPAVVAPYVNIGRTYAEKNRFKEALPYYLSAKTLDPRNRNVTYSLGVIYFKLKMYDDAIAEFRTCASTGARGLSGLLPVSYYLSKIARNYYGHGNNQKALELLDTGLFYYPDDPELKELRKKMEMGTLTPKEIMQN